MTNNKEKITTSKTILSAVTALALISGFSMTPEIFAHPTSNTHPFPNGGTQDVCIYGPNLSGVELNGSWGQGTTVANIVEKGMDEIGDNTNMDLTRLNSSCSSGVSIATGWYISDPDVKAATTVVFNGTWKHIKFSSNPAANMVSTGTCGFLQDDNLEYVANHEFGHYAGMSYSHHSNGNNHTINEANCSSEWKTIKTADKNQINGWYP